jgi:hypothetical protein
MTIDTKFLFIISIVFFLFQSCEKDEPVKPEEQQEESNNNPDSANVEDINLDYFPFFKNSQFQYSVEYKDNTEKITSTGKLLFYVTDYDEKTKIATIDVSKVYDRVLLVDKRLYFKKNSENQLLYSKDMISWTVLVNSTGESTEKPNLILAWSVSKPSSLLGSLNYGASNSSAISSLGPLSTIKNYIEYFPSGNDHYMYDSQAEEHFSKELGFVSSYSFYYDGSMGYPDIISIKLTIALCGYEIFYPDGTVKKSGEVVEMNKAPESPEDLFGERTSATTVKLTWTDKTFNEQSFVIERKNYESGDYAVIGEALANAVEYIDNSVQSGQRYIYRIAAKNETASSAYSIDVSVNLYGVPLTPWGLKVGHNYNLNFTYLLWWARYSDNITYFKVALLEGDKWTDLSLNVTPDYSSMVDGNYYQGTNLYFNSGAIWPSGTYTFKVKAVNSYGESFYTEPCSITL